MLVKELKEKRIAFANFLPKSQLLFFAQKLKENFKCFVKEKPLHLQILCFCNFLTKEFLFALG
jgi:hypothetical protein